MMYLKDCVDCGKTKTTDPDSVCASCSNKRYFKGVTQTSKPRKTDDQLLRISFDRLVHYVASEEARIKNNPIHWWHNGFDEPIDPMLLSKFMHELADRLGLKLVDGMWVEVGDDNNQDTLS